MQDGRVPLPSRLRTLAGVSDGDPVNVTLIQGRFVVTPAGRSTSVKAGSRKQRELVINRLRAEAPTALKAMWAESARQGTDKMTMREIDKIIAEVRGAQAAKQKSHNPVK